MEIKKIQTDKGVIEYSVIGKGIPILFLHGGHSNCKETLFHKGFDLAKYQLITPSRPGYGETPIRDNTTPEKAADLIMELLNNLGVKKVVLYAISAAGLTSIQFASKYPEKIDKLILASAVSKKWLNKNKPIYKIVKKIFNPKTERIMWGTIRLFALLFPKIIAKNFYRQFSKNKPHKLDKDDINELLTTFKHFNSKYGFISDIEHDIDEKRISEIKCKTFIIHSKNDNSVPFEHAQYANKMIKDSTIIGLDNEWGHLFWIGKDSYNSVKKTIQFIEQ
ncbi:MAG: alpha/beta hydrolase [Bacteroidales bacterium]|nr:alpha/beta hydrolase [Bacteroidales bacterium]